MSGAVKSDLPVASKTKATDIRDTQKLVMARYQWWQLNGKDHFNGFPPVPELEQKSNGEFRSCTEAESAARMYTIGSKRDSAARKVAYLDARGYADPNFIPVL